MNAVLPVDPPPARPRTRTNLPAPLSSFIGRVREVELVRRLLESPDVRLVTLSGAGGSGKTRLALEAARGLVGGFLDGVWLVDLAPLSDPTLVAAAVAQALGVQEAVDRAAPEGLTDFLRDSHLLLILDNFEHLLSGATLVAELLAACPHLKILATSRTVLHLSGEHEYTVAPLRVPPSGTICTSEELAAFEAARLFIERAQAAKADFEVDPENVEAIAEICLRLDGLPLAIELAAARVRLLPSNALLSRLDHRLTVLTGGARDLPVRQQTLRNTITWSHELLTPAEQRLFRRISVFAGGCSLAAVQSVSGQPPDVDNPNSDTRHPSSDVLDPITSLVDQSLLTQGETEEGEPRFRMLETIREFAGELLDASGEAGATRRLHAEYYLGLAQAPLAGTEGPRALARLDRDLDNIRLALAWTVELPERGELALRLAAALTFFWESRGYWSEGRSWLDRALEHAQGQPEKAVAGALLSAGNLANLQGENMAARGYLERSLEVWRRRDPSRETAACLRYLARVTLAEGDQVTARALCEEALAIATKLGERVETAVDLNVLANINRSEGNLAAARSCFEEALTIAREHDASPIVSLLVGGLAGVLAEQGDREAAGELYNEGLAIGRRTRDRKAIARCLFGLAALAARRGDEAEALSLVEESVTVYRQMGARLEMGGTLSLAAMLKERAGDGAAALFLYTERLASMQLGDGARLLAPSLLKLAGAWRAAPAISIEEGAVTVMLKLADHEAHLGRTVQAARLLGAIDAVRRLRRNPPREERITLTRLGGALRDALGDHRFSEAMEAGHSLSLEQAVAEALEIAEASAAFLNPAQPTAVPVPLPTYPDGLTAREVEIVRLIATGISNSQIAEGLVVSTRTVERHIGNIYGKIGVQGRSARAAVATYASRHGLLAASEAITSLNEPTRA